MDIAKNPDNAPNKEKKKSKKQLSFERMRLALEKLQLARVKTTLTLIALGFTAYKVFYVRMEEGKKPLVDFPNGRDIGMFLIFVGLVILLLSTLQHLRSIAKLKLQYADMQYSLSLLLSYIILALSLSLLLTVVFQQ
jgi:uncharacterized membrane protein YidH (DUF202 family)